MKAQHRKKTTLILLLSLILLPWSVGAHGHDEGTPLFSNEELAQMLAPVALYPDPLLSQVLIAAAYPFEIVEAERWVAANPHLTGDSLDRALLEKDWDVSVLSLCHYPKVLAMMSENLNWTARVGNAFVYQQEEVMDMVQDLRIRASAEGNLVSTSQQRVVVEERIIRIVPASTSYLYVPVYDPLLVYGAWWYPAYRPYRVYYPGVAVVGPRVVFSTRIHVGFGVIGWSMFDWPSRNVVIVNIDNTKRFNRNYHVYHGHRQVHWRPVPEKRVIRQIPPRQRGHAIGSRSGEDRAVTTPSRTTRLQARPSPSRVERGSHSAGSSGRTAFGTDRPARPQGSAITTTARPASSPGRTGTSIQTGTGDIGRTVGTGRPAPSTGEPGRTDNPRRSSESREALSGSPDRTAFSRDRATIPTRTEPGGTVRTGSSAPSVSRPDRSYRERAVDAGNSTAAARVTRSAPRATGDGESTTRAGISRGNQGTAGTSVTSPPGRERINVPGARTTGTGSEGITAGRSAPTSGSRVSGPGSSNTRTQPGASASRPSRAR